MTVKKTIIIIIATLMLALTLASCADDPADNSSAPSESQTSSQLPAESSEDAQSSEDEPDVSGGDSSTPDTSDGNTDSSKSDTSDEVITDTAQLIVATAKDLIGTTYVNGGNGPDQFDNSGLVYYCCRKYGINVPRRASQIAEYGEELTRDELAPGDIVVFSNEIDGPAAFVGIYVGGGKFIACNSTDHPTSEQDMGLNYWKTRFICGRRVV